MTDDYLIQTMSRADLGRAVDWAAAEGWKPGFNDADAFYAADPEGFFAGVLGGEMIASISLVAYDARFSFLGLYIVQPAHRGKGLGLKLWQEALARHGTPLVGLDGVVAQQENYKKSGFQLAYRNIRYRGVVPGKPSARLVAADTLPFDRLLAYDREFFPAPRADFLKNWIKPADGNALVAINDGAIAGFGVIRACLEGLKIGPLYAESDRIAEQLLIALAATARGDNIYLDVPAPNAAAIRLAERFGMRPVFETARMYTGTAPDLPLARLYGVTSFELG
ncbi:MAG TPA: GNAT family N-acetyltransferase [Stellaceae bacterium]|nr:GNAT family N-acetyltransferase [Stellaceae bacterium]